jgi:hypothetical protein
LFIAIAIRFVPDLFIFSNLFDEAFVLQPRADQLSFRLEIAAGSYKPESGVKTFL